MFVRSALLPLKVFSFGVLKLIGKIAMLMAIGLLLLWALMDQMIRSVASHSAKPKCKKHFDEDALADINQMAVERGYTHAEWLCEWTEFDVFNPRNSDFPPGCKAGFPELILLKERMARWATRAEVIKVHAELPSD